MKTILQKVHRTKILNSFITLLFFVLAGYVGYFFSLRPEFQASQVKGVITTTQKNKTPTPKSQALTIDKNVLGIITKNPSQLKSKAKPSLSRDKKPSVADLKSDPTESAQPEKKKAENNSSSTSQSNNINPSPTILQANNNITPSPTPTKQPLISIQVIPTQTPTPTLQPTLTPTPTVVANAVNLQIQTPDGTSTFTVTLKDGADVCGVLQTAKDEGKINSLTIDDSYLSSLGSRYVYEINGYKNNWTFTVNGEFSNVGCSQKFPKPNDIIVWKFS